MISSFKKRLFKNIRQILPKNIFLVLHSVYFKAKLLIVGMKNIGIVYYPQQDCIFYSLAKTGNSSVNSLFLKKNNGGFDKSNYMSIHEAKDGKFKISRETLNKKKCFLSLQLSEILLIGLFLAIRIRY